MTSYLEIDDRFGRRKLAYDLYSGQGRMVMFLPGFASSRLGTKASHLSEFCQSERRPYLRFDYSGQGESGGAIEDATLGRWLADIVALTDAHACRGMVVVGSSMGGWLMLHLARLRRDAVSGLVGMASAPDFLQSWYLSLNYNDQAKLRRQGRLLVPSDYGEPLLMTRKMVEEAENLNLLGISVSLSCPCHLIHGLKDPDVDWRVTAQLAASLDCPHVTVDLINDGDHRLSRPSDLDRMTAGIKRLDRWLEENEI